jgi:Ribonuclease G/E
VTVEVFLDDTPGEVRGIVRRNGRPTHLLIHRESDLPALRLGARSIGRVVRVEPTLGAAFVDMGVGEPFGFLSMRKSDRLTDGHKVEVEVTAEARDGKGPALRLVADASGQPGLIAEGPGVEERLAELAPGVTPVTGAEAILAGLEAEEEALASHHSFQSAGIDLSVERTRALVAVDIDHAPTPGRDARRDKTSANREGLIQTARLIGLKGWGGLVAVDLVGVGHDGAALAAMTRDAFSTPGAVAGPVNRFGVLMLSLPWRSAPFESRMLDSEGHRTIEAVAVDATRRLRLAMAQDRASPYLTAYCSPAIAAVAEPMAARLGPRARLLADPKLGLCELRINSG